MCIMLLCGTRLCFFGSIDRRRQADTALGDIERISRPFERLSVPDLIFPKFLMEKRYLSAVLVDTCQTKVFCPRFVIPSFKRSKFL